MKYLRHLVPVAALVMFGFALWFLHHELAAYRYADVVSHIQSLPARAVWLSIFYTMLSYVILVGYDMQAFLYIKRDLELKKIALTSFISYAFSNSIGHSVVTGGSVRYRLYSSWDISGEDVSKIVAFVTLTFWVGFLSLGAVLFLTEPLSFPDSSLAHLIPPKAIGVVFAGGIAGYFLMLILKRNKNVELFGWRFPVPSFEAGLGQVVLSAFDWIFAAAVLFVLIPDSPGLGFPLFLAIFLLAQIFALASQVPAGAAVFETLIVLLLSPYQAPARVLGALLVYRCVYCLLPLGIASLLFGARELFERKKRLLKWLEIVGAVIPKVAPTFFSIAVFIGGTVLLFSGATPALPNRLSWLENVLPLSVIETSHFLGSIAGAGLLLLARGLQRRLGAAYQATLILLALGICGSILKGLDYEEATILSIMLVTLWSCRENFYRKAVLQSETFTPGWIVAIVMVLAGSIWLGLFAHKHVDYSNDLWWRFSLKGDAPRFMRASVGAIGLMIIFLAAKLLRPSTPEPELPMAADLAVARRIAQTSRRTTANLALLGDKTILFNDDQTAFLMYGVQGRSWVAMGDPVGPEEELSELVWKFRELSDEHDGWMVFYEAGKEHLPLYVDMGLTLLKLGEEARVYLPDFTLEGSERKGLRYTVNQLEKKECTLEVVPPEQSPAIMGELKRISDAWLEEKKTKEKGFSLGFFHEDYLKNFPIGVVKQQGRIVAFANMWLSGDKHELSIDLMRYGPDAPPSVMEYLFIKLMMWGAAEGYEWFNLGMAPLSGLESRSLAPLWNKAGSWVFRNGEDFYNFEGLRQYKEKFHPVWEPKYLAAPSGFRLPAIFANISTLISGGLTGLFSK